MGTTYLVSCQEQAVCPSYVYNADRGRQLSDKTEAAK